MAFPATLEAALRRLTSALDHLETAAERRAQGDAQRADRDEEFQLLQKDRLRLARELEGSLARLQTLDAASAEADRRLVRAEDRIRAALGDAKAEA
jgi:hypothetical protein